MYEYNAVCFFQYVRPVEYDPSIINDDAEDTDERDSTLLVCRGYMKETFGMPSILYLLNLFVNLSSLSFLPFVLLVPWYHTIEMYKCFREC